MIEIFKLFFGYFIIFGVRESDAALKNGAASNISFTDDAVIIEAHPFQSDSRSSRQIRYDSFSPISWVQSLGEGSPCLAGDGRLGSCMSFQRCFSHFKQSYIPDKWADNSWLDQATSCSYFDLHAQPIAGTCCTTKLTTPIDNNDPFSSGEPQSSLERYYPFPSQFGGFGSFGDSGFWPPSIPTHPPKQVANWPPPIPTHPPNHHYPTHPPGSASSPVTSRPTTQRPSEVSSTSKPAYKPPTSTSAPVTNYAQCGVKNGVSPDSERIVGGQNASPNEFPWIVVLFNKGRQFCGGSLIDDIHVLTAAHCVAQMNSWDVAGLTANLGDHNIRTSYDVKHVERRIKRLVRHKGFDFSTLHNDVAVLTLDKPVTFTKDIRPICLPSVSAKSYSGHIATVAGWGSLRENGPQPSILQKVQIPIWTNSECARKYGRAAPGGIIESMICAGQAAKDSCSGDSGGPMVVNENGRWTQIGVVSWGIGCGKGQYPGVYSRVSSFLPWITKNLK